ncbi:uncharacterized protein BO97DRAFT_462235 [Aspergillus homomorphus CBS 101889]|uniref:Uncharacterized protein n=1 Tax=Aspergillus homomorphus (strain CBS 101889) TaxID=1450537 RepID=A0A395HNT4_ASPHC|nr:hypothetical protein BO97DRAFT_462235 [Aspergillus homomorphus CBS 101889]RAL07934.1 hypothetical protein BO97DRAFT_462235 [Aspergillus homomorphus CBS 101889]
MEKQLRDDAVPCSPPRDTALEQQMKLSPLELSFSRQLEVYLTVAVPVRLTPGECLAATQALVAEYPILATRLDLMRSKLTKEERSHSKPEAIFRARTVDRSLGEFVPASTAGSRSEDTEPEPVFYDPQTLEGLFQCKPGRHDSHQALSIQTVHLRDACVIRFIVQHALSDAGGVHWIAQTYCDFLSGTHHRHPAVRPDFVLKPEVIQSGAEMAAKGTTHPIAARYSQGFRVSWTRFLAAYLRQRFWAVCPTSARRVRRMLFVPQTRLDDWMSQAQSQGVQVTEHDLLMAFVYQSIFPPAATARGAHTGLIFTLNIQSHVASPKGALTNPWINVPVAPAVAQDLVRIAAHLRHTIRQAREPACVAQIIAQHVPVRNTPAVPKGYGSRTPRVALTSWSHLPWYDLEVKGTRPAFVLGNTQLTQLLTGLGVRMDDGLTTCKAGVRWEEGRQEGYWLQGRLNEGIWARMMDTLERGRREGEAMLDDVGVEKAL